VIGGGQMSLIAGSNKLSAILPTPQIDFFSLTGIDQITVAVLLDSFLTARVQKKTEIQV
jgi:hypothetical protein